MRPCHQDYEASILKPNTTVDTFRASLRLPAQCSGCTPSLSLADESARAWRSSCTTLQNKEETNTSKQVESSPYLAIQCRRNFLAPSLYGLDPRKRLMSHCACSVPPQRVEAAPAQAVDFRNQFHGSIELWNNIAAK